jgi:hypothetical protein
MTLVILQILLGIIGLAATVFAWWAKADADKKKAIADEDAKIDAANNADDITHIGGELRDK